MTTDSSRSSRTSIHVQMATETIPVVCERMRIRHPSRERLAEAAQRVAQRVAQMDPAIDLEDARIEVISGEVLRWSAEQDYTPITPFREEMVAVEINDWSPNPPPWMVP